MSVLPFRNQNLICQSTHWYHSSQRRKFHAVLTGQPAFRLQSTRLSPAPLSDTTQRRRTSERLQALPTTRTMASQSADPLVWIDCEMTGLDPATDRILEVACYITDAQLNILDQQGYHACISTPNTVLDSMNEWCVRTHTASGLVDKCLSSSAINASQAASELSAYIKRLVPTSKTALLAGNSIHADKMFLVKQPWNVVIDHLHYRLFDVSAIKEGVRRWCSPEILKGVPKKRLTHTAAEDIKESIEEARYYMKLFKSELG